MQRKVLVTGGAGFIGSAVCRRLVADGASVLNLDALTYAGNLQSLAPIDNAPNYRFAKVDICDRRAVAEAFEHLPRTTSSISPLRAMLIARSWRATRSSRPISLAPSRCGGVASLLAGVAGAAAGRVPFSARVDRRGLRLARGRGRVRRRDALRSEFALFRLQGGGRSPGLAWSRTYGFPALISNCSNNYGPYHFPEKLIPLIILNAIHGKPLPVYGAGANVRDWLYVEDHARALDVIVTRGRIGEKYNVGGRNERRNIDVVRRICTILDELRPRPSPYDSLIAFVTDRPGMISAMRSTPPSSSASLAGAPTRRSRAASRKRCVGISTTSGGGARLGRKSMPASVSA